MYALPLHNCMIWQNLFFHSPRKQERYTLVISSKSNCKSNLYLEILTSGEITIHLEKDGLIEKCKSVHSAMKANPV